MKAENPDQWRVTYIHRNGDDIWGIHLRNVLASLSDLAAEVQKHCGYGRFIARRCLSQEQPRRCYVIYSGQGEAKAEAVNLPIAEWGLPAATSRLVARHLEKYLDYQIASHVDSLRLMNVTRARRGRKQDSEITAIEIDLAQGLSIEEACTKHVKNWSDLSDDDRTVRIESVRNSLSKRRKARQTTKAARKKHRKNAGNK